MAKKLTAKQRVLKRFPKAYARDGLMSGDWYVYIPRGDGVRSLGKGGTPAQAWAAAARNYL